MASKVTVAVLEERIRGNERAHALAHTNIEDKLDKGFTDIQETFQRCLLNRHSQPWTRKQKAGGVGAGLVALATILSPVVLLILERLG